MNPVPHVTPNMWLARLLPVWALAIALPWFAACQFGGGTEDANDFRLSGTLLELDGHPAQDARVLLYPADASAAPESTLTDRRGEFRFRNVPNGIYSLVGRGGPDRNPSRATALFLPALEVKGDSLVHLAPLRLQEAAIVQGRLEGMGKRARAVLDKTPFRADVDASGGFAFAPLAPGAYLMRIFVSSVDGTEREAAHFPVSAEPGDTLDLPTVPVRLAVEWSHRMRIDVDLSGKAPNRLAGFPLLVRLDGDAFPAAAGTGGRDIRFAKPDGTPLTHEIESWNAADRKAALWVKADTLAEGTSLWMYWGNTAATQTSGRAFDSAAHAGAWHLDRDSSGTVPRMRDASGRGNPAAMKGSSPASPTQGIAGEAAVFTGTDQYLVSALPQAHPDDFTLSLWFRADGPGGKLAGLETGPDAGLYFDRHLWLDSTGHMRFGVYAPAPAVIPAADSPYVRNYAGSDTDPPGQLHIQRILVSPSVYLDGEWHHVAATLSQQGQSLYLDGMPVATNPACTTGAGFTGFWRFGGGILGSWVGATKQEYFRGALDEITVSRSRDAAWIRAAYLTQKPVAGALRFTAEY